MVKRLRVMEKKLTNSDPFRKSVDKHSIYTIKTKERDNHPPRKIDSVLSTIYSTVVFWVVRGKPSPSHNHRLLGKQRGEEIFCPLPEFDALVGIQDQPLNKCPRLL